jgi:hypothetical protein
MGRRRNKKNESVGTLSNSLTIHSFADSEKTPSRSSWKIPKSFSAGALQKVTSIEEVEVDLDDEEDLEDGEVNNESPNVIGKKDRKKMKSESRDGDLPGRHLPYDVWELIGNYILPGSVGTFGAICKDSHSVIQRPAFWLKLYRDFYHFGCELPSQLLPEKVLSQSYGLRYCYLTIVISHYVTNSHYLRN